MGETGLVFSLLSSLLVLLGLIRRSFKAFRVNPAQLLATAARGARIRMLEQKSNFRQRFEVEFQDVTRAMESRLGRLTIFIDDLDRCHPKNVVMVLEAINFLTSCGRCFVVMGLSRDQVEACVGLGYREIAEEIVSLSEMADANKSLLAPEIEKSARDFAQEKRAEFARQYLKKLINIEVPIPETNEDRANTMLTQRTPSTRERDPLDNNRLSRALRRMAVPVVLIIVAVLVFEARQ